MPNHDLHARAFNRAMEQLVQAQRNIPEQLLEFVMPLQDPHAFRELVPEPFINPFINKAKKPAAPQFDKPAIFWGGSDVDPSLYHRPMSRYCGNTNPRADKKEATQMQDCIERGQPIIGICRGAQLLNVVNGGILVQHIDHHAILGEHPCALEWEGETLQCGVSSTHHQMMVAHQDGFVIGKGPGTTGYHWNDVNTPYVYQYTTEVVYYPKTKSLCIQPHPEWMDQDKPFITWINQFIAKEFGMGPLNFAEEETLFLGRHHD